MAGGCIFIINEHMFFVKGKICLQSRCAGLECLKDMFPKRERGSVMADILSRLADELKIKKSQAENAVRLIDDGNTIPFIARYRKEVTGGLDDQLLRELFDRSYLRNLEQRRESPAPHRGAGQPDRGDKRSIEQG